MIVSITNAIADHCMNFKSALNTGYSSPFGAKKPRFLVLPVQEFLCNVVIFLFLP